MPTHDYSPEWYSIFLDVISLAQNEAEVAFIARQLPLASHPAILDLCCGPGRHAIPLAKLGYSVLGLDSNAAQIARAAAQAPPSAEFQTYDIRDLASLTGEFDGVINMWASFGYFDEATNFEILRQLATHLRPGGRAIIDVYNREHMRTVAAVEATERQGNAVKTKRRWLGSRLRVELKYGSGAGDEFEWHVYTPAELSEVCAAAGLHSVCACAWFNESLPASAEHARMQLVLERQ
ncbi:MAG: class I SAM-dependent methyltransferase [Gemmatimonadaceae bacterium]